jgi:hypothetical protein
MRILVTGSREWNSYLDVYNAIRLHATDADKDSDVTIVHGGARGADTFAGQVARDLGMVEEPHPANWDSCGPECNRTHKRQRPNGDWYCPRSGFVRNAEMVSLGADICLAFYKGASKGTDMCAKLANKSGIPLHKIMDVREE